MRIESSSGADKWVLSFGPQVLVIPIGCADHLVDRKDLITEYG